MSMSCFSVTSALLGVAVVCFIIYWRRLRSNHLWKKMGVPCENPLPFIGTDLGLFLGKTFFELDYEWYKKHGRLFGVYSGSMPTIFISDPELIKTVLVKDFHLFCDKREFKTADEMINSFISFLKGDEWKRVRSVLTPAFSSGKLKKMVKLILDCGKATNESFLQYALKDTPVDCKKLFGSFTLDVIASAAFGTKLNSHEDPDNIFVRQARKIFAAEFSLSLLMTFIFPKLARLLKLSPLNKEATSFFHDLSLSIVERRKKNNEVRDDFLNSLMEAQRNSGDKEQSSSTEDSKHGHESLVEETGGSGSHEDENQSYFKDYSKNKTISSMELVAQCVLFFLAGYDTTATTLTMVTYYLAQNPKYQEKLTEEIDTILRKYITIDTDALNEMKYADAVISETMRLSPPVTRLERTNVADYILGDTGWTLPKGTLIAVPVYGMLRDPEFFPNPEIFDPDRFLPENKSLIQPYTFLPFGAGPRNCLGMRFAIMEIKLGLLQVYKDFIFQVCPKTMIPMQYLRGTVLYQPKDVTLKVLPRSQLST